MDYPIGSKVRLTKGNSVLEVEVAKEGYTAVMQPRMSSAVIHSYERNGWKAEVMGIPLPTEPGVYVQNTMLKAMWPVLFRLQYDLQSDMNRWSVISTSAGSTVFPEGETDLRRYLFSDKTLILLSDLIKNPEN